MRLPNTNSVPGLESRAPKVSYWRALWFFISSFPVRIGLMGLGGALVFWSALGTDNDPFALLFLVVIGEMIIFIAPIPGPRGSTLGGWLLFSTVFDAIIAIRTTTPVQEDRSQPQFWKKAADNMDKAARETAMVNQWDGILAKQVSEYVCKTCTFGMLFALLIGVYVYQPIKIGLDITGPIGAITSRVDDDETQVADIENALELPTIEEKQTGRATNVVGFLVRGIKIVLLCLGLLIAWAPFAVAIIFPFWAIWALNSPIIVVQASDASDIKKKSDGDFTDIVQDVGMMLGGFAAGIKRAVKKIKK